jgi:alanine racemase
MQRFRPVWAEVDLGALQRNYTRIQSFAQSEIMPIVKADAYGHGVIPVVNTLRKCGAKRFGVALLEEALEIKQVFPDLTVMVIGTTPAEHSDIFVREDIIPGIFNFDQARALSDVARLHGKTARLHIKVDTGMGRIGCQYSDLAEILRIAALPNLYIEGIYTHFAAADQEDLNYTFTQLERFQELYKKLQIEGIRIPLRHTANSAAILQLPASHFELVRAGIILYGLAPSQQVGPGLGFEPVMSWKAEITHVKTVESGDTISYGQTFRATCPTRVATIPVGYADGLRRALSNLGEVIVRGRRAPIIGRVCMDQTMLDISDIPGVEVGETVTLIGRDGSHCIDATEMAEAQETINYEVVCSISKRVSRQYHGS